jgi:hypothetical protein
MMLMILRSFVTNLEQILELKLVIKHFVIKPWKTCALAVEKLAEDLRKDIEIFLETLLEKYKVAWGT